MKKIPIKLNFELMDYENESFSKGKCYVCYHGGNYNGSYISKKDMEKALPTILGIPIVGEYIKDLNNEIFKDVNGNYTDHEGIKDQPYPIGFIPKDANCYWEKHGEENKEYLVVEGIVLWTKRYPEAKIIFDKKFNHSMEISLKDENSGYYDKDDGFYHITDFSFEALCVLGTDNIRNDDGSVSYRGENNVEPCFPDSHFDNYSVFHSFKRQYEEMLKEFKNISIQGGDNTMNEKLVLLKKYSHLNAEKVNEIKENLEKYSLEELEDKLKEEEKLQFTLSVNQIGNAIDKILDTKKKIAKDWWGDSYETNEFYRIDLITDEKLVIVVDNSWENYYAISYSMNGDIAILDFENKKKYMRGDWRPVSEGASFDNVTFSVMKNFYDKQMKEYINKAEEKAKNEINVKETEEYKSLNSEFEKIKEKYSKVESKPDEKLQLDYNQLKEDFDKATEELENLQSNFGKIVAEKEDLSKDFNKMTSEKELVEEELGKYKIKEKQFKIDELFSKQEFEILKENEEFTKLKKQAIDMEISDTENKLFIMLGKFASKTFSKKKDESIMNFGLYKYQSKEDEDKDIPDYEKMWGSNE